jgi:hypothetical protein
MIVTLNEAKKYLRVDYPDEDSIIRKFIQTGETLTEATLRKTITPTKLNKVAVLYVVGYLFEHREDADMDEVTKNLRYILFADREAAF